MSTTPRGLIVDDEADVACAITRFLACRVGTHPEERSCGRTLS
jgi:hypothetical protein